MDPKAALDSAQSSIDSGNRAEAIEYLGNYREWRKNGGFEPPNGDVYYEQLMTQARALPAR